jgi:Cu-Zn family superoxide dismutase
MKLRLDGTGLRRMPAVIILAASAMMLGGCGILFQDHDKRASAVLQPSGGNATRGSVTLIERSDGVQVTYNLSGMPPDSDHALQIHERGDCIVGSLPDTGEVFAPASERTTSGSKMEGDLATIHADANGSATGFIVAPDVSLDGVRSVLSRAIILHRDAADHYSLVPHGAGPALACGVIHQ